MDKDYPKVSIMIATYNRAHYLADAIEISLAEDYPHFKVIVSDNASINDTGEVIRKYISDPRFRYFRNPQNLGSGPNYRELLYEYANGQFGHFLTDNDYFIVSKVLGLETVGEYFLVKRIYLVLPVSILLSFCASGPPILNRWSRKTSSGWKRCFERQLVML